MRLHDGLFAAIILLVVSALVYISITGRHPQPTSKQVAGHSQIRPSTQRSTCLECHDPVKGTAKRILPSHPEKWKDEKFSCLKCHKLQE